MNKASFYVFRSLEIWLAKLIQIGISPWVLEEIKNCKQGRREMTFLEWHFLVAGPLFFNMVISETSKRLSSTLIIFVALNHGEDRGQTECISIGESRQVSMKGNEMD